MGRRSADATATDKVVEAANAARAAGADLLVTFGGGSVTDAGKVMQVCLEHGVTDMAELDAYCIGTTDDGKVTGKNADLLESASYPIEFCRCVADLHLRFVASTDSGTPGPGPQPKRMRVS